MRNTDKRQKLQQTAFTLLGILFVGALFCLAVAFPTYYGMIYDKNTLNKVNYTDIKINTYETSYETFPEKIHSFARVYSEEGIIHAIRISEPENWMSRQELTDIANRELRTIKNNDMMGAIQNEKITLKEKKLSVCERYTIYKTQNQDDLQGISFWKLTYKKAKKNITLYLDEEFHKIYYLDIEFKPQKYAKTTSETSALSIYNNSVYKYDAESQNESFYQWWDGIRHYYGIDSYELQSNNYKVSSWTTIDPLEGIIEFDTQYSIRLYERWLLYDKNGRKHWCMGIPMEEMIQF